MLLPCYCIFPLLSLTCLPAYNMLMLILHLFLCTCTRTPAYLHAFYSLIYSSPFLPALLPALPTYTYNLCHALMHASHCLPHACLCLHHLLHGFLPLSACTHHCCSTTTCHASPAAINNACNVYVATPTTSTYLPTTTYSPFYCIKYT